MPLFFKYYPILARKPKRNATKMCFIFQLFLKSMSAFSASNSEIVRFSILGVIKECVWSLLMYLQLAAIIFYVGRYL